MAEHRFNKKSSIECCLWGLFFSSRCCNSLQPAGKSEVESERKRERERENNRESSRFDMPSKLTQGFQNITCYLAGVGQLPDISQFFYSPLPPLCPQCGIVIGLMLIRVPGSLRTSQLSDRSWSVCWETSDVKESMPLITGRCALLVCIYVFKLPSAVRIINDRRWNKGISQSFAWNHNYYVQSLTCEIFSNLQLSFLFLSLIHDFKKILYWAMLSFYYCVSQLLECRAIKMHVTLYTCFSSCDWQHWGWRGG